MTAVAGGARHDPRILTAGMQGRRGCLEAFRGPCRPPGVLTTTAHPATTPDALPSTSRKIWKFPDTIFGILPDRPCQPQAGRSYNKCIPFRRALFNSTAATATSAALFALAEISQRRRAPAGGKLDKNTRLLPVARIQRYTEYSAGEIGRYSAEFIGRRAISRAPPPLMLSWGVRCALRGFVIRGRIRQKLAVRGKVCRGCRLKNFVSGNGFCNRAAFLGIFREIFVGVK